MKKYFLSVGAIFKNEAMIMREWLDHYIKHGVDHFYLIDDESTDNYKNILKDYEGLITLFHPHFPRGLNRQSLIYEKCFTPILHETDWLAVLDLDEYLYSPNVINLKEVFKYYGWVPKIIVNWVWFGNNGIDLQPKSIVQSFTKRGEYDVKRISNCKDGRILNDTKGRKYIINTSFTVKDWPIHSSEGTNLSWEFSGEWPILLINHYPIMSKEYFFNYKCMREPCANDYNLANKDIQYFIDWDINDVEDLRLANQNISD